MQKRNVLNSPRLAELKKHRQRAVLNKILLSGFGFLVIIISIIYLSRTNSLNIGEIEIIGNKVLNTEAIKEAVQSQIAGKYLWFFPKTNILLYPKGAIERELHNKFKGINDINLSIKNNNNVLIVSITERKAVYIWCGPTPPEIKTANQDCYFVDENGYIFDQAPNFSGEVYFKFYGGNVVDNNPLGSHFSNSTPQNFSQLISFKDALLSMGLKPIAIYQTSDGDIQILLSSITTSLASSPKIILRADADFQNVIENLDAALNTEPLLSKFKNNYVKLEYIDLRFGNKVYDKFQ